MHPEDQSLSRFNQRMMIVTTPTSPLFSHWRELSLGLRESRNPSRQTLGSVSAGERPVGSGSHSEGWCGFASILLRTRKWAHVNQSRWSSWFHPGSYDQQGSRTWRYTEKESQASFPARDSYTRRAFQRNPPNAAFPTSMEAHPRDLHP